jgi:hypothetical protein
VLNKPALAAQRRAVRHNPAFGIAAQVVRRKLTDADPAYTPTASMVLRQQQHISGDARTFGHGPEHSASRDAGALIRASACSWLSQMPVRVPLRLMTFTGPIP